MIKIIGIMSLISLSMHAAQPSKKIDVEKIETTKIPTGKRIPTATLEHNDEIREDSNAPLYENNLRNMRVNLVPAASNITLLSILGNPVDIESKNWVSIDDLPNNAVYGSLVAFYYQRTAENVGINPRYGVIINKIDAQGNTNKETPPAFFDIQVGTTAILTGVPKKFVRLYNP